MPVRFLSDAELARLSSWPDEIADDDLVSYFTLTSDDLGWLGSNVQVENWLGAAVQLCALPWLGWIPDELSACPSAAVRRLAGQLRLADDDVLGLLSAYGGWEGRRTRRDHRALVLGIHRRKPLPAAHRIGMVGARALLADRQGALVQAADTVEVALLAKDNPEGIEAVGGAGMVGAQARLADRQARANRALACSYSAWPLRYRAARISRLEVSVDIAS
jgi:Domain of unknown function (DUF4158)